MASVPGTLEEHVVVGLVPDQITGPWQSRHDVLSRLAGKAPVLWCPPPLHLGQAHRLPWLTTIERSGDHENLWTLEQGRSHPLVYRPDSLRKISLDRYASVIADAAGKLAKQLLVSLWRPEFVETARRLPSSRVIYHVDDEYSFLDSEPPPSVLEVQALSIADHVIFTSRRLAERKARYCREFSIVPHGVDIGRFSRPHAPVEWLRHVPRPRLCYVGRIKDQLDFELVEHLVTRRPEWSFVFVGDMMPHDAATRACERLKSRRNWYQFPAVDHGAVPAILRDCDVGLLPYKITGYTMNIQPLKLPEYLAAGLPVVSVELPAVNAVDGLVWINKTKESIEESIGLCLRRSRSEVAGKAVSEARKYDWNDIEPVISNIYLD